MPQTAGEVVLLKEGFIKLWFGPDNSAAVHDDAKKVISIDLYAVGKEQLQSNGTTKEDLPYRFKFPIQTGPDYAAADSDIPPILPLAFQERLFPFPTVTKEAQLTWHYRMELKVYNPLTGDVLFTANSKDYVDESKIGPIYYLPKYIPETGGTSLITNTATFQASAYVGATFFKMVIKPAPFTVTWSLEYQGVDYYSGLDKENLVSFTVTFKDSVIPDMDFSSTHSWVHKFGQKAIIIPPFTITHVLGMIAEIYTRKGYYDMEHVKETGQVAPAPGPAYKEYVYQQATVNLIGESQDPIETQYNIHYRGYFKTFAHIYDFTPTAEVLYDAQFVDLTVFGRRTFPDPATGPYPFNTAANDVRLSTGLPHLDYWDNLLWSFDLVNSVWQQTEYESSLPPGIQCLKATSIECKFHKHIENNSYSMFVSAASDGLYLRTYSESPNKGVPKGLESLGDPIWGSTGNTIVVWFKIEIVVGQHLCDLMKLFVSAGVNIQRNPSGLIHVEGNPTTLTVETDTWYVLAATTHSILQSDVGPNNMRASYRLILGKTSEANTLWQEVTDFVDYTISKEDHLKKKTTIGGSGCSAQIYAKIAYQAWAGLAPLTPGTCDDLIPFEVYDTYERAKFDPAYTNYGSPKKCLKSRTTPDVNDRIKIPYTETDPKTGALGATLTAGQFPADATIGGIGRLDTPNCPIHLQVKTSKSGTECVCPPGILETTVVCKCPKSHIEYYDQRYFICAECPAFTVPNAAGDGCDAIPPPVKTTLGYISSWDQSSKTITVTFEGDIPESFTKTGANIRDFLFISVSGLRLEEDFTVETEFQPTSKVMKIQIDAKKPLDFKEVLFSLFDRELLFDPEESEFVTGADNQNSSGFKIITDGITPEAVEVTEHVLLLSGIVFPSFLEKMPFIFTFFSFLRTLNFYPVKLPANLDSFLKMFYVPYQGTYGYKILKNYLPKDQNPPSLNIENRGIRISKVLYFSNTIPVISVVSKIALIWYLIKWFKKSKQANAESLENEIRDQESQSTIAKITDWMFIKFMSFLMVKVHIYMYSRLIFVFTSFEGFSDVMAYSPLLAYVNIFEGLFDLVVICGIELKIYDYLKHPKTKAQLLMLDLVNIKTILMIDIFKRDSKNRHSAIYLCLMNLHLFLLATTLVVFNKFKEMLFVCHITQMLMMAAYTFLGRNKFKKSIDFFIYFSNALSFVGIIMMYSLFMYYGELNLKTSGIVGLIVSLFILVLIIVKIVFFSVKMFRDYQTWREQRSTANRVAKGAKLNAKSLEQLISTNKLNKIDGEELSHKKKRSENDKILIKKKVKKLSPNMMKTNGSKSTLAKDNGGNLLKFVMSKQALQNSMKFENGDPVSPQSLGNNTLDGQSAEGENGKQSSRFGNASRSKRIRNSIKVKRGDIKQSARSMRSKMNKQARQISQIALGNGESMNSMTKLNSARFSNSGSNGDSSDGKMSRRQERKVRNSIASHKFSEIHIDSERGSEEDGSGGFSKNQSHKQSRFAQPQELDFDVGHQADPFNEDHNSVNAGNELISDDEDAFGGSMRHISKKKSPNRKGSMRIAPAPKHVKRNRSTEKNKSTFQREDAQKMSRFGRKPEKEEFNSSLELTSGDEL